MSQELIGNQSNSSIPPKATSEDLSAYKIISKKRNGGALSKAEIQWFIESLLEKKVADYQMSALLMCIYFQGLNPQETHFLTEVMLSSGRTLNFNDQHVIDKHSTGGVGDKTSFIIAPLAAACGVKVPMIAGRSLGHTGGTIDKIEAVSGFQTNLSLSQFETQLKKYGMVLMGQTDDIAPADKIIYALRDVTATIESIPLITASILSKKLAEGAEGIVMDIKTGSGAFMEKLEDAQKLGRSIADVALSFGKNIQITISDMSQPLGRCVGHAIEITECVEVLKGGGPEDLVTLSLHLAGGMIHLAGIKPDLESGIKMAAQALKDGSALKKFRELIELQGGRADFIDDPSILRLAPVQSKINATKTGTITHIRNAELGLHCVTLGGGRQKSTDQIDHSIGFKMNCRIGDKIKPGDNLLTIYHHPHQTQLVNQISESIQHQDIVISDDNSNISPLPLIYETHTYWSSKHV